MNKYFDFVENAAKLVSEDASQSAVFFNSGPIHAAIVMSRIFKYSKGEINIFCGGFDGSISNDVEYLKYLEDFLRKGGKLKVYVQNDNTKSGKSNIFRVLKRYPNNYELWKTGVTVMDGEGQSPIHFMIGDDTFLRVETNVNDYTAKVNFGNPEEVNTFKGIFHDIGQFGLQRLYA